MSKKEDKNIVLFQIMIAILIAFSFNTYLMVNSYIGLNLTFLITSSLFIGLGIFITNFIINKGLISDHFYISSMLLYGIIYMGFFMLDSFLFPGMISSMTIELFSRVFVRAMLFYLLTRLIAINIVNNKKK